MMFKKIILNRTGEMSIIVEMVDEIEATRAGKWKFNVREIRKNEDITHK
jgi:flagellar basal body rod protein FlgC